MTVSVITCTSDRPEAFRLCARWLLRQNYTGDIHWVIADDSTDDYVSETVRECSEFMDVTHVRGRPIRNPVVSFLANMRRAAEAATGAWCAIMEDDDYYGPNWLARCVAGLESSDLYGQNGARYYHVRSGRYMVFCKSSHASLAQLAIRSEMRDALISSIEFCQKNSSMFLDMTLCKRISLTKYDPVRDVVSMKGLPGKTNIGVGRKMKNRGNYDADGSILKQWCGQDAPVYERYRK